MNVHLINFCIRSQITDNLKICSVTLEEQCGTKSSSIQQVKEV